MDSNSNLINRKSQNCDFKIETNLWY